jgi:microcystin-dependent protein
LAGTLPSIPLSQQFNINGTPLAGALLYTFAVGTVATPQNTYQDFGLTILNPNPLSADQYGRFPMFYMADGQVHVRATDPSGVVLFDYPTMQVIGPSSGGGGGGSVDPTSVFSSGDIKIRATSEILIGWVKANGTTIGSPTSGASQRGNNDTQNLYTYLWQEYANTKCPVVGGRGVSGLADFQANKTIQVPDWRGMSFAGLDDMGSAAAGRILASNVTSGGGDGPTTPAATGGEANHTLVVAEMARGLVTLTQSPHSHAPNSPSTGYLENLIAAGAIGLAGSGAPAIDVTTAPTTASANANVILTDNGGNGAHNNMPPFVLATIYLKL